jgi:glycerol dehydrogenase
MAGEAGGSILTFGRTTMNGTREPFLPESIYGVATVSGSPPRAFISPQRYVQGPGVLDRLGDFIGHLDAASVAILASARAHDTEGVRAVRALTNAGVESVSRTFGGECTLEEVEHHVDALRTGDVDAVIALGGGKCVDAGKGIAHLLGVPVAVVPTLASNDAPCSALSVMYRSDGTSTGVEFFPKSPALVLVDTGVIASAPERFLVSGMGDAMATWYEASVAINNPTGFSSIRGRPTIAAAAIGEACARTLFDDGVGAAAAVAKGTVDHSLEQVVEANTLLSGLGFESGGLAAAHGVAQSCNLVDVVHDRYLHGEMVAFGLMAQLVMEDRPSEARRVAEFFCSVGLPVHLGHLSLTPADGASLRAIADGTVDFPTTPNMPMQIDRAFVLESFAGAHEIGTAVVNDVGDDAYQRLHN